MKHQKLWHIYVKCESSERFCVNAPSKEKALEIYERGEAHQCQDEVDSRVVVEVLPA